MDKNLTIAAYVIQFFTERAAANPSTFFANELYSYVQLNSGRLPAPGTVDRIMRKLRAENKINYIVSNRNTGYYMALPVASK